MRLNSIVLCVSIEKAFLMSILRRLFNKIPSFLYKSRRTQLLIVVASVITFISYVLISIWLSKSYTPTILSNGTMYVIGLEAYGGDIRLANGLHSIDWGAFQVGESKNVSMYLRNPNNVPTKLAFNTTNWNPESMAKYVTLLWNYDGTQLTPGEEIPLQFTLTTNGTEDFVNYLVLNNVNSYNFTICIYARE